MSVYEENLELLARFNPEAAIHLAYLDPQENDYFDQTAIETEKEVRGWFEKLQLTTQQVLYVFGVGLGHIYTAAQEWLAQDSKRSLVFLEDNPAVLQILLGTEKGTQILKNPQVYLRFFTTLANTGPPFNALYLHFLNQQIEVVASPYYAKKRSAFFDRLRHKIFYESSLMNELFQEYLNCGATFYKNFYENFRKLPTAYHGNALFGKFKGIPAIICGAGPSLEKNATLLKTLSDRALIFGGGSSLNALKAHGFLPHFGAGVDPNPTQYERLLKSADLRVPFLYRNRIYPAALDCVQGPHLYVNGAGGYATAEWLEAKLGIEDEVVDEGHNVVNFCTEIAFAMGCNPIIYVGMDLAFTNMRSYASGVLEEASVTEDNTTFLYPSIDGNPVYTQWKWIAEAEWIGAFAKKNSEATLINATEGGIGFPEIPNQKLSEVVDTYLTRKFDLAQRVEEEIDKSAFVGLTQEKVNGALNELAESLLKAIGYLDALLKETQRLREVLQKDQREHAPHEFLAGMQSGEAALWETELFEEAAFTAVLEVFNTAFDLQVQKEMEALTSLTSPLSTRQRELRIVEIKAQKYAFLKKTAEVNVYLLTSSSS